MCIQVHLDYPPSHVNCLISAFSTMGNAPIFLISIRNSAPSSFPITIALRKTPSGSVGLQPRSTLALIDGSSNFSVAAVTKPCGGTYPLVALCSGCSKIPGLTVLA